VATLVVNWKIISEIIKEIILEIILDFQGDEKVRTFAS